ncbi:MAG: DUF6049 family protein [Gordonia sp. (in: high G+C Gram-positive bacteria)]
MPAVTADRPVTSPHRIARLSRQLPAVLLSAFLLIATGVLPQTVPSARADTDDPGYATLAVTDLTPSTVTSTSNGTVTVTGRITNTFDRPLDHLAIQVQRGPAVAAAVDLRTSLMGDPSSFPVMADPHPAATRLDPGKSADFTVRLPLSSSDGLSISQAGVYPLLVGVTGAPESSRPIQLINSRTLLPVLSLPADADRAKGYVDPADGGPTDGVAGLLRRDGSVAPDVRSPASFTMIWPLSSPPQQSPGILGGGTEPLRLTSDELADDLGPKGRLGTQLEALAGLAGVDDDTPAPSASADPSGTPSGSSTTPAPTTKDDDSPDGRLRRSICVAVDPDLLVTVKAMSGGYLVSKDPADPRSDTRPGRGQDAASAWLHKLGDTAKRLCVTALPFAQAGLDSLKLIDDDGLTSTALKSPADLVSSILGVDVVRGLTIPAIGTLSDQGRKLLESQQLGAAAVASSSLTPTDTSDDGRYRSGAVGLQSYDAPISGALGAMGSRPLVPAIMPNWQQPDLSGESQASRRQAAAAALVYPMLANAGKQDDAPAGPNPSITGRSAFVMPPTYWSPSLNDANALLDSARVMLSAGVARALPLDELVEQLPQASKRVTLTNPGDVEPIVAQGFPVSGKDVNTMRAQLDTTWQLQSSLIDQVDSSTTPQNYLAPLREDILRAIATPETVDLAGSRTARDLRIGGVGSTLNRMRESVALLDPGGRYTLASERSPLLLVVRNELALPIRVRLDINAPKDLEVGDVGVVEIPAQGTRQLQIPTHASSSQKATVTISLVTSTGVAMSNPIDLSIYSNAYGKPLFWITICAAVILVLLTARRLWHRFRGQADPADEDRPEPDEHELMLASAPYEQRLETSREYRAEVPLTELPVDLGSDDAAPEEPVSDDDAHPASGDAADTVPSDDRPERS